MQRNTGLMMMVVALMLARPAAAIVGYDDLLRKIPSDANMLVVVDAKGLFGSEMSKAQFWNQQRSMQSADRALTVPLHAEKYVRGSRIDLYSGKPAWEVVAARWDSPFDTDAIAKAEGGHTDKIGAYDAAYSPRDFFAVKFEDRLVAAYIPSDRQGATRWVRGADARLEPALSPYLSFAADQIDIDTTQLAVAMDLEGIVSADEIYPDVAMMKLVTDADLDPRQVADALASIRGITLAVAVTDGAKAVFTVTFNDDVSVLEPIAVPLLDQVLSNKGMYISEVSDFKAQVSGKTIVYRGDLLASGLRRVGSLIAGPTPDTKHDADEAKESAEPLEPAQASLAYFKAVTGMLDDVSKAQNADRISDIAHYLQRYARNIDNLPILNVDPELVAWGGYVSSSLRDASVRLKDVRLRSASRAAKHNNFYDTKDTGGSPTRTVAIRSSGSSYNRYGGGGGYRGGYGGGSSYNRGRSTRLENVQVREEEYRLQYQDRKRKNIAREERASGLQDGMNIVKEIQNSTGQIRQEMTVKYQIEF